MNQLIAHAFRTNQKLRFTLTRGPVMSGHVIGVPTEFPGVFKFRSEPVHGIIHDSYIAAAHIIELEYVITRPDGTEGFGV